jgi:hypothetical protein
VRCQYGAALGNEGDAAAAAMLAGEIETSRQTGTHPDLARLLAFADRPERANM